ncbi:hypothetical protein [Sporomusa malonica]|uniref:Uncharacterized protein n=1 Tax=Sporomusa malonica TaxID=112901 RepID=A0A1W2EF85_9FIRM|nr:hypothetical protein [Sporomusa malonica]SMD07956.1 hypothetical protein SAMN04488500_12366 [Sporomusa malonica]
MKKLVLLVLAIFVMAMSSTASAKERHHDWSGSKFNNGRWQQSHAVSERHMPFKWHERRDRDTVSRYRLERIHDYRMSERFPGLHAYKWRDHNGRNFYYNGKRVKDAVLFYDDSDELVSVGFMRAGKFIVIRDDDRSYETHDDFLTSWLKVLIVNEIMRS